MKRGMMIASFLIGLVAMAAAQAGSEKFYAEKGPDIVLFTCSSPGSCKEKKLKLTIDSNWRWTHGKDGYQNCYDGNEWVDEFCPPDDGKTCAQNCVLEGNTAEKYEGTYGVTAMENGVQMKFVNDHEYGTSVGSRLYMYSEDKYEMFKVVNQELAFSADMSQLECGMNGAIYLVEMQENGGKGLGDNDAGAKYGTGYCDAQCPHDMKYIDGEANIKGWKANEKDKSGNMGTGHYGACCNEMDIWEANARSQAFTPHPCSFNKPEAKLGTTGKTLPGLYRCEGQECGDNDAGQRYEGVCDKDGCDFASWRMGNQKFYGKGSEFDINTEKEFTQVTQWITDDGKDSGDLVEIRRVWVQDGKTIQNTDAPHMRGVKHKDGKKKDCKGAGSSSNDDICWSQNQRFGDYNHFQHHGGHKEMGESLKRGHVLAISLWDDVDVSMMWLDSCWPRSPVDCKRAGVSRGPCEGGEKSTPTYVRKTYPDNVVKYWDFKVGCLGCTTKGVEKGPKAMTMTADEKGGPVECPYAGDDDKGGDDNDNSEDPDDGPSPQPRRRRRSKESARRRRRSKESTRRRSKN